MELEVTTGFIEGCCQGSQGIYMGVFDFFLLHGMVARLQITLCGPTIIFAEGVVVQLRKPLRNCDNLTSLGLSLNPKPYITPTLNP